jgi:hypothetical protein
MKRISLLLCILVLAGCARQEVTSLEGTFAGMAPKEVHVVFPSPKGAVDTLVAVTDNAFSIGLPVDKTVSGYFSFTLDEERSKAFLSDGSKLRYVIKEDKISMTSSNSKSINYELEAFFDKQAEVFQKVQKDPDGTLLKREGLRGKGIDSILSEYLK